MEANISWFHFFSIIAILIGIYILFKIILRILPQIFKRKSVINKSILLINKTIDIYVPIAILLILLSFVFINYKVHGILFLLLLVISYSHIKRYIQGVLFKINPLVTIGSNISTGEYSGTISKFLFFGFIINEEDANRFINYSYIDANGFSINQNDNTSVRRTVYIYDQEKTTPVLDLLFENPSIDFNTKPIIKKVPNENMFQLQIALENGAKLDSLVDYLNQHKINTSPTKK